MMLLKKKYNLMEILYFLDSDGNWYIIEECKLIFVGLRPNLIKWEIT